MRRYLLVPVAILPALVWAEVDVRKACIVVDPGATKTERFAAQELRDALGQICGVEIPLQEGGTAKANAILVGQGPVAAKLLKGFDWHNLAPEQTLVRSAGSRLIVAGGRERGTLYAVYRLLQEDCGVRWWAPWATMLPKNPKLRLGAVDASETPAFEYREPYWSHTSEGVWALRNCINGATVDADESKGGKITYQGFVHTYYPLVPPEKNFGSHPDWYSLINGKRTTQDAQLCTTNPALRDYVVDQVRQELRANPQAMIVSVSQNDCFNPCQCDNCRTLAKDQGSDAALVLDLANYVADKIKDEFPKVAVDTLAYQWSRHPVKTMRPRPNVIVRLCSIECDFAKPLNAPANQAFADDLAGWNKLTNRLYVWDYCTNFAHYLQPQPDYFSLGQTIKWFSQNGVKGVFEEGDYTSAGGDMAELKAWVSAQMLWNPKQDPDALVAEFVDGYFGPAAPPVKQYLRLMADAAQGTHVSFYLDTNADFLRYGVMKRAMALWSEAKKLTADAPEFRTRVDKAALCPQYVWLSRWNEFRKEAAKSGDSWPMADTRQRAAADWLAECNRSSLPGQPLVTAVDEGGTTPKAWADALGP